MMKTHHFIQKVVYFLVFIALDFLKASFVTVIGNFNWATKFDYITRKMDFFFSKFQRRHEFFGKHVFHLILIMHEIHRIIAFDIGISMNYKYMWYKNSTQHTIPWVTLLSIMIGLISTITDQWEYRWEYRFFSSFILSYFVSFFKSLFLVHNVNEFWDWINYCANFYKWILCVWTGCCLCNCSTNN